MKHPYVEAPSAIRPTLSEPTRLVDTFPATLRRLRTLQEVREARVDQAAARFRQAVEDARTPGGAA